MNIIQGSLPQLPDVPPERLYNPISLISLIGILPLTVQTTPGRGMLKN